jgi:2,4-dienoyl-CoA reductase-like NADH-dependent reductase (Old Yellow Enzyme family)
MSTLATTPLTLPSGLVLPNRLAKAAMSEMLGDASGAPTPALSTLTACMGKSGVALQITGNVMIDPAHLGEPGNVVVAPGLGAAHEAALAQWASSTSTPTLVQLNHPGRQSPKSLNPTPVAPSAVQLAQAGAFARPRALDADEVEGVVAAFAAAARLVQQAGFAGVQLHAAHGYLLSQFLSPKTNLRTDRFGGSLENRARVLLAVVDAVRAACGPAFTLAVKLNSADFQRGGFSHDDALHVASWLDEHGVDLLEISGGTYERPAMAGNGERASTAEREAYFLTYAQGIRDRLRRTPLMLTGGLRSRAGIEACLASGVDVVGLARPLTREPDLPHRLLRDAAARARETRPLLHVPTVDALVDVAVTQAELTALAHGKDPAQIPPRAWLLAKKLLAVRFGGPMRAPTSTTSTNSTASTNSTNSTAATTVAP